MSVESTDGEASVSDDEAEEDLKVTAKGTATAKDSEAKNIYVTSGEGKADVDNAAAAEKLAAQGGATRRKPVKRVKSHEVLSVEEELKNILGTKVTIVAKGRGGAIEVEYYSDDELNRLIDLLKTAKA